MNAAEVQVTLNLLGSTPREVAATLENKGIKGYRRCSRGPCPVEVFLTEQFPEVAWSVGLTVAVDLLNPSDVPLPPPVATFIRSFDNGRYPRLVKS